MNGSSLQLHCNKEGINVQLGIHRVRFGIISDDFSNCFIPDSRLGFGCHGNSNACGNVAFAQWEADNGDKNTRGFGYVLVR